VLADWSDLRSSIKGRSPVTETFPQTFGPYVLIRLLGVGAQGDVYVALTGKAGMEKPCVVKRLAQHSSEADHTRFRREANLARKLSHGAIAQTIGVDEIATELVIAQELLQGVNLSNLLGLCLRQRIKIPISLTVHIARELARALAYAHAEGVIHRDIAPDNVILTYGGEVKLFDFGIARSTADPRLTLPGSVAARQAYASPEVAAGEGGDARSDIFSLGVLLWQLLALRPPPLDNPPAVSTYRADVPAELDAVIMRALARSPAARFSQAKQFLQALGAFVPVDFAGEGEVGSFLRAHCDVAREQLLLDEDLARGRAFLQASAPAFDELPAGQGRQLRSFGVLITSAAAGVLLALVLFHSSHPPASPSTSATPHLGAAPQAALPPAPPLRPPPTPPATAPAFVTPPEPVQPSVLPILPSPRPRVVNRQRADHPAVVPLAPSASPDLLAAAMRHFDTGDMDLTLQAAHDAARAGAGAPAHVLAGRALAKKHQLREAEREFGIAVRLDPSNAFAAQYLRDIRAQLGAGAAGTDN
jgi:serine/threonine protein kinase